ncbi:sulfotransferase 1C4-like [Oratosquilla oratoria]|uniref:sulfotransferase 1C4-like n=1 Tax=Oratosquilla oratoria TaxID=337810 RepID=UPI003F7688C7
MAEKVGGISASRRRRGGQRNKMKLKSGHFFERLSKSEEEARLRDFPGHIVGDIRLKPGGWILPSTFTKIGNRIYEFQFREGDVVIMTHPKAGATWAQELVWTMKNNPDFNHPEAGLAVNIRCPALETDMNMFGRMRDAIPPAPESPVYHRFYTMCPDGDVDDGPVLQTIEATKGPRVMKTHLAFDLMSPNILDTTKVIYMLRNPKDVCVSNHHYYRINRAHDFQGTMDDWVNYMVKDELNFGPYWQHIREAYKRSGHPNLHFLFYENLKYDPLPEILDLDQFLGTRLQVDQMQKVIEYTSFENMKIRESQLPLDDEMTQKVLNIDIVNREGGFFRRGVVGDYKNILTSEQEAKIDDWIKANSGDLDITFRYN